MASVHRDQRELVWVSHRQVESVPGLRPTNAGLRDALAARLTDAPPDRGPNGSGPMLRRWWWSRGCPPMVRCLGDQGTLTLPYGTLATPHSHGSEVHLRSNVVTGEERVCKQISLLGREDTVTYNEVLLLKGIDHRNVAKIFEDVEGQAVPAGGVGVEDAQPGVESKTDAGEASLDFGQPVGEVRQGVDRPLGRPVRVQRSRPPGVEDPPVRRHPAAVLGDEAHGSGLVVGPRSEVGGGGHCFELFGGPDTSRSECWALQVNSAARADPSGEAQRPAVEARGLSDSVTYEPSASIRAGFSTSIRCRTFSSIPVSCIRGTTRSRMCAYPWPP
jgi:hypothetical protein